MDASRIQGRNRLTTSSIEEMKERVLRIGEDALFRRMQREVGGKMRHGSSGIVMHLEDLFVLLDYVEALEQKVAEL